LGRVNGAFTRLNENRILEYDIAAPRGGLTISAAKPVIVGRSMMTR